MIVDCLSCGATYNISDEKVRGRRVRVRCKSCGEGIIVDGIRVETEDATRVYAPNFEPAAYSAGRDEATRVMTATATTGFNEPDEDEWTVNISETEQRTMRLEEIVSGYGSGLVDDNAYVWKDGMADWVPLKEISEIRAALEYVETTRVVSPSSLKPPQAQRPSPMPPKAPYAGVETPRIPSAPPSALSAPVPLPPPSAPPLSPPVAVNVPAAVPTQVGGFPVPPPPSAPPPAPSASHAKVTYSAPAPPPRPFVRGPEPASSVEYQAPELKRNPPPARVKETRQRADLFGNSGAAGAEDELLRSESVPLSAYDEKPTGARNESSVLFSLDTLKAGARRGTPSSAPPRAAAAAPPTAADILGMSAGGALPSAPSLLSAPVMDARPPPSAPPPLVRTEATVPRARMDTTPPTSRVKPKTGLLIAVIVGAVTVAGAAALVFKDRFMSPRPVAEAEAKPAPTVAPAKPPPPPVEAPTTVVATAEPTPPPVETAAPVPEKPPAREPETKHAVAPRPPTPAPAPRAERAPVQDDSEALKSAIRSDDKPATDKAPAAEKVVLAEESGEAPEAPAAPPEEAAKPPFDTGAAKAALASAASGVASCKKPFNPTGSGKVQVTFAPSGRATAVTMIDGAFDGTPVGGCVTKLFRAAKVPAFSGEPVTVAKSFSIPE
jgi:predicted Zn finger-like uncharacterized protein